MKTAHFKAYGVIGSDFTSDTVNTFLSTLSSDTEKIEVRINSPGGNVEQAFDIRDLLMNSGKKIRTVADGKCYSAAPLIFLCGQERVITNDTMFMVHSPWIQPGADATFTGDQMLSEASHLKAYENKMAATFANGTGAGEDVIKELMRVETFITPSQALELKFATEIAEPVRAMAFLNNNKTESQIMSTFKKMFDDFAAEIKSLFNPKAEEATPPAEPTPDPVPPVEKTLEEQIAELKAENEALKKEKADMETEATTALASLKEQYITLAKSVKSTATLQTGQTNLSRSTTVEPEDKVEAMLKRRAERAGKMQTVK